MMTDTNNNENKIYLEGLISLNAALDSEKRKIYNVYIDKEKFAKRDRKITHLVSRLKKKVSSVHTMRQKTN